MRKSRFSIEQIVAALQQVESGMPVADLTRRLGISEQTYYRWKKEYAGLQPDQAREPSSCSVEWSGSRRQRSATP